VEVILTVRRVASISPRLPSSQEVTYLTLMWKNSKHLMMNRASVRALAAPTVVMNPEDYKE